MNFLSVVIEIDKRMPANMAAFYHIKFLHPRSMLGEQHPSLGAMPNIDNLSISIIRMVELKDQWRKLPLVDWQDEFDNKVGRSIFLQIKSFLYFA